MNHAWESLAAGVYRCRLSFLDVNVGLVCGPERALLIDCGTTLSEAASIADDVTTLAGHAVSDLVLTHHHFDHILGSGGFPGVRLYAGAPVAAALSTGVAGVREHALRYGANPGEIDDAVAAARRPDYAVDHVRIDLGDRFVTVEHPGRGHTDHDLAVVVPPLTDSDRTVVFCGDLVEESADPAIDEGADLAAWPAAVDRVLALGGPAARYVPGHGAVVDADFLVRQRDWLLQAAANRRPQERN